MLRVYGWNLATIIYIMIFAVLLWTALSVFLPQKLWRWINAALACVAFLIILKYTVLGRTPGEVHEMRFMAQYSNEFYREMLMNVFLYFPLGLTLSVVAGPGVVGVGFLLTVSIEAWQFFAGTGLAQGTDIICNTLGMAIGALPCIRRLWRHE